MANREIHEMISSFAAGCMDRENFINFKNYMLKGNDLPYRELGELQNTIALLPVILEKELPSEEIKNKILSKTFVQESPLSAEDELPESKDEILPEPSKEEKIDVNKITDEIKDEEIAAMPLSFTKINEQEKEEKLPPVPVKKSSVFHSDKFLLFLIPSVLVLLILTIMLIITSSQTSKINLLEEKLTGLIAENNQIKEYIKDNSIFTEFFNYPDILTLQLKGSKANPDRSGKIFIAGTNDEALLDLANIPALPDEEVYQVWAFIGEDTFSLGTFSPESGKRYYKLTNLLKFDIKRLKKIEITSESIPSSFIPEGEVFYSSGG